jgi:sugar lactone lactonase YvrE
VDSEGRVYATDPENARVLIFSSDGQYLARFGQPGGGIDSLGLPNGITIDDQDNVYLSDARNNRILRFAASDFANLAPPPPPGADTGADQQPADDDPFQEQPDDPADRDEPQPSPTPPDGGE